MWNLEDRLSHPLLRPAEGFCIPSSTASSGQYNRDRTLYGRKNSTMHHLRYVVSLRSPQYQAKMQLALSDENRLYSAFSDCRSKTQLCSPRRGSSSCAFKLLLNITFTLGTALAHPLLFIPSHQAIVLEYSTLKVKQSNRLKLYEHIHKPPCEGRGRRTPNLKNPKNPHE